MGFCIYIRRKWFVLVFGIWIVWWTKVLILVGFDDIGCDIWIKLVKSVKSTDFLDDS